MITTNETLAQQAQAGDKQAQETLLTRNMGLVYKQAHIFTKRGMSVEDLVQEGTIGMLTAIEKFDVFKGVQFSTYATTWIQSTMRRAVAKQVPVLKRGVRMIELEEKCAHAMEVILGRGDEPTTEALAAETGLTVKRVAEVMQTRESALSLEHPDAAEVETAGFEDDVLDAALFEQVWKRCTEVLDERDQQILALRFGLGGQEPLGTRAVAEIVGVSHQTVANREKAAMERLQTALA